ncbi:outer membrane beta-barrel protein [Cognatishimia sp.]|uniref:outer membrane beta-barrel protein n=1 Tax=Cognatishimia sp. TaxID=2211648 RepID=UPI0035110032
MSKSPSGVAALGLTAFALPASAQDVYLGGALSSGEIELSFFNQSNTIRSVDVFGGARFDMGTSMFFGVEAQATFSDGYIAGGGGPAGKNNTFQGEVHMGYAADWGRVYGFVGFGKTNLSGLNNPDVTTGSDVTLYGLGTDISLSDSLALRIEVEMSDMSVTDNCCGAFNVSTKEVSVGAVYSF